MKNYVIAAGGSGVRALEAMLQVCAAGLGPEEIKVLVIDPDASNGNYTRTNGLFANYQKCSTAYRSKLGDVPFFATKLTPLAGGIGRLQAWSPVDTGQVFRQVLGILNPRCVSTILRQPALEFSEFFPRWMVEKAG
jgi:hypothetical protein